MLILVLFAFDASPFDNLRSGLRTIYNSIYMLGLLFGSYIFGWISDTHGRMKALMLSVLSVALSGTLGYTLNVYIWQLNIYF